MVTQQGSLKRPPFLLSKALDLKWPTHYTPHINYRGDTQYVHNTTGH